MHQHEPLHSPGCIRCRKGPASSVSSPASSEPPSPSRAGPAPSFIGVSGGSSTGLGSYSAHSFQVGTLEGPVVVVTGGSWSISASSSQTCSSERRGSFTKTPMPATTTPVKELLSTKHHRLNNRRSQTPGEVTKVAPTTPNTSTSKGGSVTMPSRTGLAYAPAAPVGPPGGQAVEERQAVTLPAAFTSQKRTSRPARSGVQPRRSEPKVRARPLKRRG